MSSFLCCNWLRTVFLPIFRQEKRDRNVEDNRPSLGHLGSPITSNITWTGRCSYVDHAVRGSWNVTVRFRPVRRSIISQRLHVFDLVCSFPTFSRKSLTVLIALMIRRVPHHPITSWSFELWYFLIACARDSWPLFLNVFLSVSVHIRLVLYLWMTSCNCGFCMAPRFPQPVLPS